MESTNSEVRQAVAKSVNAKAAAESLMIPKHRFDCVNLAFKETKQALREKIAEAEAGRLRIAELEKALLESQTETAYGILSAINSSVTNYLKKNGRTKK